MSDELYDQVKKRSADADKERGIESADADADKERGIAKLDDAELEGIAGGIVGFPERHI